MLKKRTTLSIAAMFAAILSFAQDRIYTRDGGMYEVKIREIGQKTVVYKKWNNQDGPDFVLPKNRIERIRFQNGDEEKFVSSKEPRETSIAKRNDDRYGKNVLALSPVHMTNASAVGIGLSYERVIDKNHIISFYLPLVYSFKNDDRRYDFNTSYPYNEKTNMAWFYPGVKIYPTGSNGVVRYSVGPSLAFGTGTRSYTRDVYNPTTGGTIARRFNDDVFVMGFLVNNTLNIHPTPKLHLGLELGLGIPYYTQEGDYTNSTYYEHTFSDEPLVQFNFKVGYRF